MAVLVLGLSALAASPAQSVVTLTSNVNKRDTGGLVFTYNNEHAQKFTTGTNSAGYELTSIELKFADVDTGDAAPTVTLRDSEGADPAEAVLTTLTAPGSFGSGLIRWSTCMRPRTPPRPERTRTLTGPGRAPGR